MALGKIITWQIKRRLKPMLEPVAKKISRWYLGKVLESEYHDQTYAKMNERPVEWRFVLESLSEIVPESVLDVGTGKTAFPHVLRSCGFAVTAIDNIRDYWTEDVFNRHFYVQDDDITQTRLNKKFDAICCISVLEHIQAYEAGVRSMVSLVKPGGHLLLSFPYNEAKYVDNVYDLPDAGYGKGFAYICQMFSRKELDRWSEEHKLKIVKQEYWQIFTGELWTFGERLYPPRMVSPEARHQLACVLMRKL
jgi:SAM-dependent methyltransferase